VTLGRPEFHLARVFDDGTQGQAEIVPVTRVPWETAMDRRGAIGLGLGIGAVAALAGCARTVTAEELQAPAAAPEPSNSKGSCLEIERSHDPLRISGDGRWLASKAPTGFKIWDLEKGESVREVPSPPGGWLMRFTANPPGAWLSNWTWHGFDPGQEILKTGLAFAETGLGEPSDSPIAAARGSGALEIWNLDDRVAIAKLDAPRLGEYGVDAMAYEASRGMFARSAHDSTPGERRVQLWDGRTGSRLALGDRDHHFSTENLIGFLRFVTRPRMSLLVVSKGRAGPFGLGGHAVYLDLIDATDGARLAKAKVSGELADLGSLACSVDGQERHVTIQLAGAGGAGRSVVQLSLPDLERMLVVRTRSWFGSVGDGRYLLADGRIVDVDAGNALVTVPVGVREVVARSRRALCFEDEQRSLWIWRASDPTNTFGPISVPAGSENRASSLPRPVALSDDGSVVVFAAKAGFEVWDVARRERRHCLVDPAALPRGEEVITASIRTEREVRTEVLPCGTPLPANATCTCNCVGGLKAAPIATPSSSSSSGGGSHRVCTCVPVFRRSSRRWKQDVRPLDGALDRVRRLRGVRFEWTPDAPDGLGGADLGVIAEEVAEVVPELVARDERGAPVAVDYARMTALLIEAVKTQQQQIEALERQLARRRRKTKGKRT
jgi:hypothetical protein